MATNEELRRLAQAATLRPWRQLKDSLDPPEHWIVAGEGIFGQEQICGPSEAVLDNPDYEYIVAACNEVPRLLDEIADYAETKRRMTDDYFAMDAGLRDLEKQLATKDRRIEALRKGIELHGIIGSCDCDTKHPDIAIHKPYCTYRNFSLLLEADDRASKETP